MPISCLYDGSGENLGENTIVGDFEGKHEDMMRSLESHLKL
jgi:hypothetical protein